MPGPQDPLIKGQLPQGMLPKDLLPGENLSEQQGSKGQQQGAKGTLGPNVQFGSDAEGVASKKDGAPFSEKLFKNVMDKMDKSDVGGGTPASQGLPLSSYLEPATAQQTAEPDAVRPPLNVQDIEKMVDRMLVGVNASGDPQIKVDVHLDSLGPLKIEVTRTDAGLQVQFNAETDRAALQLNQNMPQLQDLLMQKGLQVNNIELLVANEPLAINQMIDSPRPGSMDRVHRKDRAQKIFGDKLQKSTPQGGKG